MSLSRKFLVPSLLLLSITLTGCQLNSLSLKPEIEQAKNTNKTWKQDGNKYSTQVEYSTPGGEEINTYEITLDNGVVTDIKVGILTNVDVSIRYQQAFAKELPKLIVGKKLADLGPIDRLSGASVTTTAFNQALAKLQDQL